MSQSHQTFDGIAKQLGDFTCRDAPAFVHLRDPFGLSNWTLPVLELMMVAGAALALWWAIRRLRRDGHPANLVLWYLGVLPVLWVTALPAYFGAVDGVTADDTPAGSLLYAAGSFVVAALLVMSVAVARRSTRFTKSRENVTVGQWTQEISSKSRRSNN